MEQSEGHHNHPLDAPGGRPGDSKLPFGATKRAPRKPLQFGQVTAKDEILRRYSLPAARRNSHLVMAQKPREIDSGPPGAGHPNAPHRPKRDRQAPPRGNLAPIPSVDGRRGEQALRLARWRIQSPGHRASGCAPGGEAHQADVSRAVGSSTRCCASSSVRPTIGISML